MSETNSMARVDLPAKKFDTEFFVGLFCLAGLLCFAYLSVNLAGMKFFDKGYYKITAIFSNVSGVDVGAPVLLAGVTVGEVSNIALSNTSALVTLSIKEGVKLRDDDIAAVRTKGIIGDRYIKIIPGASADYLSADSELTDTESVVELEEIVGKFIHKME